MRPADRTCLAVFRRPGTAVSAFLIRQRVSRPHEHGIRPLTGVWDRVRDRLAFDDGTRGCGLGRASGLASSLWFAFGFHGLALDPGHLLSWGFGRVCWRPAAIGTVPDFGRSADFPRCDWVAYGSLHRRGRGDCAGARGADRSCGRVGRSLWWSPGSCGAGAVASSSGCGDRGS